MLVEPLAKFLTKIGLTSPKFGLKGLLNAKFGGGY